MIGAKCSWRVQGKRQDGCSWIGRAESAALNRTLTISTRRCSSSSSSSSSSSNYFFSGEPQTQSPTRSQAVMSTRRTRGRRNVGGKHGSMTHIVLAGSSESDERLVCSVSDVDTVTAMGKSETSVGRRSSDEDDDEDDASCEWFSGFSVGERDRTCIFQLFSTRVEISTRPLDAG